MHSHNDNYPSRPGFELGTSRLQAPVDTNDPSGRSSGILFPRTERDRLEPGTVLPAFIPGKTHETLPQCCFNVGPPTSTTLA